MLTYFWDNQKYLEISIRTHGNLFTMCKGGVEKNVFYGQLDRKGCPLDFTNLSYVIFGVILQLSKGKIWVIFFTNA